MAIQVPMPELPLTGLNQAISTGGNLFSQMMNPVIQRENMARQWKEHLDNLAISKAAQGRLAQAAADAHKLAQFNISKAERESDPAKQMAYIQQLLYGLHGKNQGQAQQPMNLFSGLGMPSTEEINKPTVKPPSQDQLQNGFSLLNLSPEDRMALSLSGIKVPEIKQTQSEKDAAALNLFKQKEDIKAANKSGETATNKVLTQSQQAVQAIDTVLPMIDEFINNPKLVFGATDFSPSKKAAYNAKTGGMIDMLVAAQSLPQVKESVNLVEQQIRRGTGESTDAYIKRLKDFRKDLLSRREKASSVVNSKKVNAAALPVETKVVNGVTYYSDGKGGWEHD